MKKFSGGFFSLASRCSRSPSFLCSLMCWSISWCWPGLQGCRNPTGAGSRRFSFLGRPVRQCQACSARSTKCRRACASICAIHATCLKCRSTNFNTYHMTEPQVFYQQGGRLGAAHARNSAARRLSMEPYYVLMKLPGEDRLGSSAHDPRHAAQPRQHDRLDRGPVGFPRLWPDDRLQVIKGQPHPWAAPDRSDN